MHSRNASGKGFYMNVHGGYSECPAFLPGSLWMLFSRGTDEVCKLTASEQPKQPR